MKMHQQSYVTDLLDRHQIVKGGTLAGIGVPEEEDPPSPKDVHKAQVVTGELLWLSARTRPDITYPVAVMARRPQGAVKIGEKVLQYLWRTAKEGLHYKRLGEGDHGPDHQQHRGMRWSPTRTRPSEPTRTSLSPAWRCITPVALFSGLPRVRLVLLSARRKASWPPSSRPGRL